MNEKEHTPLSASRIKNFDSCSYSYYCNYILRIPQSGNTGSSKGSIAHEVFELLLDPKYREHYDRIVAANSIKASDFIYNHVKDAVKKDDILINKEEELKHIEEMILVGLNHDFFVEGGELIEPEYKFNVTNEENTVSVRGFIDKAAIKDDKIFIYDYKSSKKRFTPEDLVSNIQALSYSWVAKKLWPHLKPIVRFIFLQFPEDPVQELEFNNSTLKGFEHYLAAIQEKIDNFTEKDAKENFAADKTPKDGGFNGNLLCGKAKYPNQIKKDGSKSWHCSFKFPFSYYVSLKDGKIMNSSFKQEDLKVVEGETIEKREFLGCPRHNNVVKDFNTPIVSNRNVLEDF